MDSTERMKWRTEIAQEVIHQAKPEIDKAWTLEGGTTTEYKEFATAGYEAFLRLGSALLAFGVPAHALEWGTDFLERTNGAIMEAIEENADKLVGAGQS